MPRENDETSNRSGNRAFESVLEAHLSRRRILQGGVGLAAAAFLGGPLVARDALPGVVQAGVDGGDGGAGEGKAIASQFRFKSVPVSTADDVLVPEGYVAEAFYKWGEPVSDGPEFKDDASNSAEDQAQQAGMHHDGMHYFPFPDAPSEHGLLVVNHEYTDDGLLHPDGMDPWTEEKATKSKAAHGVSVIEIRLGSDGWEIVRPSNYGRRVTGDSPTLLTGPVAGSDFVKTDADPEGLHVLGTLNNCAHGHTPWGTYLTCEENWNGYFANEVDDPIPEDQRRYGVGNEDWGYRWHEFDERFRAGEHPNELNRFGWVVEIDPFDPESVPLKRTALGRIKHEGAWSTVAKNGHVVVYSGDDERNEYIYKFVSDGVYDADDAENNRDLLAEGTLYVARFDEDGSGEWLALVYGENGLTEENGFSSQAEVLIKTRQAADRVGATMMDRPEWIAVHPWTQEVYCTLTNNNRRGSDPESINEEDGTTQAGSARPPVDAPNPRADNVYGHIIRWRESGRDSTALTFNWDIFVLCGDPENEDENKHGDINGDPFGSPDGLWFDDGGLLWIQTDVSTSALGEGDYANLGHNMMLAADIYTGEIRRFLTGPSGSEVTGVVTTPDRKYMFVNIQHPGEPADELTDPTDPKGISTWPDGDDGGRPRSATVLIYKEDGGVIGS